MCVSTPSRSRRPLLLPAALAASLCVLSALACGPRKLEEVPPQLLGIWKTRAPRHARNFVEIRPHSVVLGVVGMELEVVPIETIELSRRNRSEEVYRLGFTASEGYLDAVEVTWLAQERAIRVGSAPGSWKRSAER